MILISLMLTIVAILMVLGIPLGITLIIVSAGFLLYYNPNTTLLISGCHRIHEGILSFPLLAVPFFIFVGLMMNKGGMTQRLFRFAKDLVGHLPGGLAHVNVLASMIFAGMSGSAVADASGLGVVEIQAMKEDGYDVDFSAAVTAASSTIGPVIPPSIPFVIYGWLAGVSVGKLFLAGFVPGVSMGLSMMLVIAILSKKRKYPRHPRASFREILRSGVDAGLALISPVIIVGGIITGVFTPTEAAAVASVYAFVIVTFIYRTVTLKDIWEVLLQTVQLTVKIMFVIAAASFFSWVARYLQIPTILLESFLSISTNPVVIVSIIIGLVLILGCFIEGIGIMLMTVPIFLSVLRELNVDLIYFGVVFTLSIMIGLVTPPFGLSLYAVSGITGRDFGAIVKATIPFLVILFVPLVLCLYFPQFTLFIPSLITP